jgi:hypothetical protein
MKAQSFITFLKQQVLNAMAGCFCFVIVFDGRPKTAYGT